MEVISYQGKEYELQSIYNEIERDFGQVEIGFEIWSTNKGIYMIAGRLIDYSNNHSDILILGVTEDPESFEDVVETFELAKHYKTKSYEEDTI